MYETTIMPQDETRDILAQALISAHDCLVFDSKDFSLDPRDAWLYGILVGWGDDLTNIAKQCRWSIENTARLESYNKAIEAYKDSKRDPRHIEEVRQAIVEQKAKPVWNKQ